MTNTTKVVSDILDKADIEWELEGLHTYILYGEKSKLESLTFPFPVDMREVFVENGHAVEITIPRIAIGYDT